MSDTRQKIPVPRRFFLWSLNETSGEILTHVGPTEFTPSANDRIVRLPEGGGVEQAPMEAKPFVLGKDGEYVLLRNPVAEESDDGPNGSFVPGGNKEKSLLLGTTKVIPGPCAFPLWPGQFATVRPAHKLSPNDYLLCEVVGPVDRKARYYDQVLRAAGLSQAVIDNQEGEVEGETAEGEAPTQAHQLTVGQRIVIQGRLTQLFIPPTGIEVVPPIDETQSDDADGIDALPAQVQMEAAEMISVVGGGVSRKQFSILKNELRHRQDLTLTQRAIILTALDEAFEDRTKKVRKGKSRGESLHAARDPYARRAVVLGPKEFCVLFDADGKPRIVRGPARVSPGPNDTFKQRGSRRRVYDAYELGKHQALWLRIITPITREKLMTALPQGHTLEVEKEIYPAGHELIFRGQPSVFFPFIEAEIIHPKSREPHFGNEHDDVVIDAVGIDQKSGVYVRDLRSGMVKMVRGETSYLVDPRSEEHVKRRVPKEAWNLWIGHSEPHKKTDKDFVETPWAVSIPIPNNEACLITSRHGRRIEVGPKVVLLEYEEALTPLTLSRGASKDGSQTVTTCFLRVHGARMADTFVVESSDFVRFTLRLGFAGHFEGETEAERESWFQVQDPVKLLADTVRARVREAARELPATRLIRDVPALVRGAILGTGDKKGLYFSDNGMVIDAVDVLSVAISDPSLAKLFDEVQRTAVHLQLKDEEATRRLISERHRDQVDQEENELLRKAAMRKAETGIVDAEAEHQVQKKTSSLEADRKWADADAEQTRLKAALLAALDRDKTRLLAESEGLLQRAQSEAEAAALRNAAEESHLSKIAEIEAVRAASGAEAYARKVAAIQPELVAALHSASDTEVMKAAAENMNLVSLLGGKSPLELLTQLLKGTPLSRTPASMKARSGAKGDAEEA